MLKLKNEVEVIHVPLPPERVKEWWEAMRLVVELCSNLDEHELNAANRPGEMLNSDISITKGDAIK